MGGLLTLSVASADVGGCITEQTAKKLMKYTFKADLASLPTGVATVGFYEVYSGMMHREEDANDKHKAKRNEL